eukprot:c11539_g1_i2.p1 GENE.c11539_g1_i2~~c11539_g1_i2.p1  ORF type:complete len:189 (+),score=43.24 c11539_g1_i2:362-928(+)
MVEKLANKIDPQFLKNEKVAGERAEAEAQAAALEEEFRLWKKHMVEDDDDIDIRNSVLIFSFKAIELKIVMCVCLYACVHVCVHVYAHSCEYGNVCMISASHSATSHEINIGSQVQIQGLVRKQQFNGSFGTVVAGPYGGRWEVQVLDGLGLMVRPNHIHVVSGAPVTGSHTHTTSITNISGAKPDNS